MKLLFYTLLIILISVLSTLIITYFMAKNFKLTRKNKKNSLNSSNQKPIRAIATFLPEVSNGVSGNVIFEEIENNTKVKVSINLNGLTEGKHGFHVHETGNLQQKCDSCKAHFNPYNTVHGGLDDDKEHRHVGDFGNVIADMTGKVRMEFIDDLITLRGTKCNIIGRSLIVHEKEDDLGKTPNSPESLINGLAGARLGCAIIGYMDPYYF